VGDREQPGQPAAQVTALGWRGGELLGVAADARPDDRDEQGIAGGEVPEDGAPADPGGLGHVLDGGGQAAGGERRPGGAQDPLLGDLTLLAGERQHGKASFTGAGLHHSLMLAPAHCVCHT
jgi:hypothetical protein